MPTWLVALIAVCLLAGCAANRTVPEKSAPGFSVSDFAKTDIDRVAEAHQREIFQNLQADFRGDRVLAFAVGLASMIQTAYHDKTEFFVLDDLDPQGLYNAARNVEIAVWKLSNSRTPQGEPYLLSNEGAGAVPNLSFEREFGKVIASLDILSKIIADKSNRTVVKVVQSLATAVFLPIK